MSQPQVWVVPVNYNGLADTRKCLHSLAMLDYPAKTVVIDNASAPDPTAGLRAAFPWADVVRNGRNLGWSGGNNTGIRHALEHGADWVFLLNNDTTVAPDIITRLVAAADAHPSYGVIGPVIRYMDEPDVVMTDGVVFNRLTYPGFLERRVVPERRTDPPTVADVDIVNGCAMMIRADVFARIGLISDLFFLIHEESDFCLRAKRAGFGCGVLAEPLVWHKGSTAFKRTGKRWQRYYDARNLGLLVSRHAGRTPGGRGGLRAYGVYLRYAYHRYCHEAEDGHPDAADAVLDGLVDFVTRRFGPMPAGRRWAVPGLRAAFDAARRLKPPARGAVERRKDLA